jgi:hypothetical protein
MKLRIPSLTLCLLLIAGILAGPVRLHAQATTASIHGTVTDSSGAVLPDATVTVVNTSPSISATQKTDSKGYFIFPDLHIGGPYTVTVGKEGLQKFVSTGIMLDLSSVREVAATLQIGASSQTILVNSARSR